jgi:hypothetical protein
MKSKRKPLTDEQKENLRQKALQRNLNKSKGLGDTVEKITEATGIKKAVKFVSDITGIDCGCDKRKEVLNKLFPYKKINCLTDNSFNYLIEFFEANTMVLDVKAQRRLIKIYLEVFDIQLEHSNCTDCWRGRVSDLRRIFEETKKDIKIN